VLSRWQGGLGALIVTLVACALVILDLTDAVRQLKSASAPLLQALDPETQQAVRGGRPD
jgi:hypothetical protein